MEKFSFNPIEKKFDLEIKDPSQIEKKISKEDIRSLSLDKIPDKIYEIFLKKAEKFLDIEVYDPQNKFSLEDKIYFVDDVNINVGGAKEYPVIFRIAGSFGELESKYKEKLKEEINKLNLKNDSVYAINDWNQVFCVYGKDVREEDINDGLKTEGMYDANLVHDGGDPAF